uniref:NADH dehydrogenase subunit 2 n=1 Tax=Stenothyra glabra TaxID=1345646 RepID=UPI0026E13D01|nr:NADH dehydrogenase subunit 2 [Stenothyra glabra]USN91690.1 NADH dehydrogenase subunit 2 [Stenothyra glabra]
MFSNLPFSLGFFSVMFFGTVFSISSTHWLGIWAGLEINLIGFLPLLVYQKSMSESESAVKYFVVQTMGSSLLMFGSLSSYNMLFTWEMIDFSSSHLLGVIVIFSGLMLKMGVFPFHFWLPSVMAGLPWLSCLLLATWQKVAPLFLITSFVESILIFSVFFVFCLLSGGSSLMGGVGGMNQTQLRALVAYSSIGHLGWILYAVMHSSWAMKSYFSIYVIISVCIFVSLWYSNMNSMKNMNSRLSNLLSMNSVLLMFLSLGGLPPLLGFISKWIVIGVGTQGISWVFMGVLITGSLLSLFYYLSLFFSLFLSSFKKKMTEYSIKYDFNFLVGFGLVLNLFGGLLLVCSDSLMLL